MHAHLKAIRQKHEGQRDIEKADLKTYLNEQVGVGDHGDIGEVIERKLEAVAKHQGIVDTINEYIRSDGLNKTLEVIEE